MPETNAKILVYDVGQTSVYPRNRDTRGFNLMCETWGRSLHPRPDTPEPAMPDLFDR
jgi:hypothetical protein